MNELAAVLWLVLVASPLAVGLFRWAARGWPSNQPDYSEWNLRNWADSLGLTLIDHHVVRHTRTLSQVVFWVQAEGVDGRQCPGWVYCNGAQPDPLNRRARVRWEGTAPVTGPPVNLQVDPLWDGRLDAASVEVARRNPEDDPLWDRRVDAGAVA